MYHSDGTLFALSNAVVGLTKNKFDELKKKYSSLSSMIYDGGTKQQEAVFNAVVSSSKSYEDAAKNLNNSGITYRNWKVDSVNEDYAVLSMKKNNDVYKLVIRPKDKKTYDSKKTDSKKEAPKKKVPSGKKVSYDDDIVAVYDDKGKKVYEGMLDYSPYQLDDSKWNEKDKNYDLPKGYKMVGK